jgi:DNA excision repair protein ERCC-2
VGDRLSGAVIVGVGLPQVCLEREIIRQYFEEKNGMGFEYSYIYPGMNKVLQAAGRVIRTENDRGVVLLIDERFSHSNYKNLFPSEWSHVKRVNNERSLIKILENFWYK